MTILYRTIYTYFRCLTKQEVILQGLSTGKDAPLEVCWGGIAGRGVFATGRIHEADWLCEFKTSRLFPPTQREQYEEEYKKNREVSHIFDCMYPIPKVGRMCFDATRRYHQLGRYINRALPPNAVLTRPYWVRNKWRIGFIATREIEEGDEVVCNH